MPNCRLTVHPLIVTFNRSKFFINYQKQNNEKATNFPKQFWQKANGQRHEKTTGRCIARRLMGLHGRWLRMLSVQIAMPSSLL